MKEMIKAATIGGNDASGGAGLEADLKTFEEYGLYGMVALTSIACMDPDKNWGHVVFPIGADALEAQMKTIFQGVGVAAVKSGMLGSNEAVELTAKYVKKFNVPYVLDPVMVCKGANEALNPELNNAIAVKLLPVTLVATPNLFEASQLAGVGEITTIDGMKEAAKIIAGKGAKNVYIKGGSKLPNQTESVDLFYDGSRFELVKSEMVHTNWTHGAGCTQSAAVTAGIARGMAPYDAAVLSKKFITASLSHSWPLNKWVGPGNPSAWRSDKLFN
jgi:pyridoxine kinase